MVDKHDVRPGIAGGRGLHALFQRRGAAKASLDRGQKLRMIRRWLEITTGQPVSWNKPGELIVRFRRELNRLSADGPKVNSPPKLS